MWRILVVSDSHGRDENVFKAMEQAGEIDNFIHLGDVGTGYREMQKRAGGRGYIVRGNCDYDYELKTDVRPYFGPHKIFATHGHMQGVSGGLNMLRYTALSAGCNIALYGHTHVPVISAPELESPMMIGSKTKASDEVALVYEGSLTENDVIILNPGSVSLPRQEGNRRTYALLELGEDSSVRIEIRYLA